MNRLRNFWHNALNQRLIALPPLTPSHELPDSPLFRSLTLRLLWGFWTRFLSAGGRYFFLATTLFLLYGISAFETQAFVPLAYALAVWFFALLSMVFEKPRVELKSRHAGRMAVGEKMSVELEIRGTARRISGESAVIPHRLPAEIDIVPATGAPLPPLSQGGVARVHFELQSQKRGLYTLRGYRVQTSYPFGLLHAARVFNRPEKLTVTPHFEPLERLDLPLGGRNQSGGVNFVPARGESLEYIGNRDYREGDNVRDIDWRATARLSRPIVREYREEVWIRAAIILDTQMTGTAPNRAADFERAVSLSAACAEFFSRSDFSTQFLAVGNEFHKLNADRGDAALEEMLDILAGAQADAESPWDVLWPQLDENLEHLTCVVCIFLDWDESRRTFAFHLLEAGTAVKCLVVREGAPTLDPAASWLGDVPVLGADEFDQGIRQL